MKTLSVAFLLAFFSITLFAQSSVELKLKPEKNKVYRLRSTSTQNIQINNGMYTTVVKNNTAISFKAMDVTPEFIVAEIRLDTINSDIQAPGMVMKISSTKTGNLSSSDLGEIMSVFMNRLSKNPIYVKLSPVGTLMEVINQKMLSDIILKNVDSISGPMGNAIKPQIKKIVEVKSLRAMIEPITAILPGKAVSAGDTWTNLLTIDSEGSSFNYKNSFKLNRINGNSAEVSCESWVEPTSAGTYDVKGPGKSTIIIDTKSGLLTKNSSSQTLQGNINANGNQMPAQIESTTEIIGI